MSAQILKQNNTRLENRTQLVTMCHMGPKVFINCAGFIKIDTASLGDRSVLVLLQMCIVYKSPYDRSLHCWCPEDGKILLNIFTL